MWIGRRSSSETNHLERVSRRVTLGVSLALLLAGGFVVGIVWWEQRDAWNEATRAKKYDHPQVYVMQLGVVQFPPGFNDQRIVEELDRSAPAAVQRATTRGAILRSIRIANLAYADLTDSQVASKLINDDRRAWSALADVVVGDGMEVNLLSALPPSPFHLAKGDDISHLYLAAAPGQTPILYTRGQAIKAVAASDERAKVIMQELATYYDSPRPRQKPLPIYRAAALVAAISIGVPWAIFFFLRWLGRSISSTVGPEGALRNVHVCKKCKSTKIARDARRDAIERFTLKLRGKFPYRCLDCDHRFYDRPLSKKH